MTEQEWMACTDPQKMLEFLREKASKRKLQLFVCAACRRHWPLLEEECIGSAVEISEQYADGNVGDAELVSTANMTWPIRKRSDDNAPEHRVRWAVAWSTASANRYFAENASAYLLGATGGIIKYLLGALGIVMSQPERLSQVGMLCDIFGNPFRPVALPLAWMVWQGGTIPKMAQTIYDYRAFDRMPVLADALEEAGVHDTDILAHCRRPGPNVRGCWVVDLLLGKE